MITLTYGPIDEKNASITCNKSRDFFADMEITGEIISTTSYNEYRESVVLGRGEYIVGDLEMIEYLDAYEEILPMSRSQSLFWALDIAYHG